MWWETENRNRRVRLLITSEYVTALRFVFSDLPQAGGLEYLRSQDVVVHYPGSKANVSERSLPIVYIYTFLFSVIGKL
jgi:hypothetical protein